MKFLLLYPNWQPKDVDDLKCFSDVWGYYLSKELSNHVDTTHAVIPGRLDEHELHTWFESLDVAGYDAVIALGLRYFSQIAKSTVEQLRKRVYPGFLCQVYDGSRLDNDGVDITFTLKDESNNEKYKPGADANRHVRHRAFNEYVGWAADIDLNVRNQDSEHLRLLVDHTNYAQNPIDRSDDILKQIKQFVDSGIWKEQWKSVTVRRFDSGKVVTVDLDNLLPVTRYDRTGIPYRSVCEEHSRAHAFFVTHPESVGLVVLETAVAGALTVTPNGFIPLDRLKTVKHITYGDEIDWNSVLSNINPSACRKFAKTNTWEAVAKRIRDTVGIRRAIRGTTND
jgi:hypothetical protein